MDRNKNLLIVGAGIYGLVAKEIADSLKCFENIAFVDDIKTETSNGIKVVGTTKDIEKLTLEYGNAFVAIGNAEVRLQLIRKIEEEMPCRIVTLVSPRAYVSPSAQIGKGSIVEPMAVVHTGCVIATGCIISASAVVNHASMCCDGVHVDCNATVAGHTLVPAGTKVCSGQVFKRDEVKSEDLFFNPIEWEKKLQTIQTGNLNGTPQPINGKVYSFDDVM